MSTGAADVVRDYYDALREGDPLEPYFHAADATVKFGISEALFGYDAVADALRTQTETTDEWSVQSRHLTVDERESFATFADEVTMAWTDAESGDRRRFDSRWSGTLVPAATADIDTDTDAVAGDRHATMPDWLFTSMHVSAPHDL
ncbi:nuclear transport factor 2 family protein [Halopiger thermotolerans]